MNGRNPLVTGMIGMHGSQASNIAVNECDILIAVGCRFSDRVATEPETFASQAKIVHIDIDRSEINKNVKTDHHIVGDAKEVLRLLIERLDQQDHSEWKKFVFSYPTETKYDEGGETLNPKQVCDTIARLMPMDTIVSTDVGQHQMWAIQHFHFDYPGQLITSGGFGTMGFGLGAAIGAQVGNPDKSVILVAGDGSFRMNCHELTTAQYYDLPIIIFVFNNQTLGMVRQWQNLIYHKNFSQSDMDRGPDFVKLADAYGLKGYRVNNQKDLAAAIEDAKASGKCCVIDCILDIDEMVRPMVGGGSHITNFMRI
jgi:acetolactate synthase-1/2/3 large subunit